MVYFLERVNFVTTTIKTDFGQIHIAPNVVAMIAGLSAMECMGVVGMAATNMKDGIVHLLKLESLTKGIQVRTFGEDSEDKTSIEIDLHIIVEYGTNIKAIADTLVEMVQYQVEEAVGIPVTKVTVFVDGVRIDA